MFAQGEGAGDHQGPDCRHHLAERHHRQRRRDTACEGRERRGRREGERNTKRKGRGRGNEGGAEMLTGVLQTWTMQERETECHAKCLPNHPKVGDTSREEGQEEEE